MALMFVLSVGLVFHAYFGYPITLALLAAATRRAPKRRAIQPTVSLVITACNEERRIGEKLANTINLEYPRGKFQVIVASDGSTDGTNDIVGGLAAHGIELLAFADRRGKETAQKDALTFCTGEIIVFSDVATRLAPDAISTIVANFADPSVGCVSSVDRVIGRDGKPCGEGLYVKYEMWLRSLESRVHSLVGLSGSFFAARSEVCRDFSGEMQSDFRTVLNSIKLGLRGISDGNAVGYYDDIADSKREFDRKVRTVLRGITVFWRSVEFLNFFRYGFFSYEFFCHKLLRWLVPLFLATALTTNAVLASASAAYAGVLLLQVGFYAVALAGLSAPSATRNAVVKIPVYFLTVNLAIVVAWWKFLTGKRMVMWVPSQR